MKIFYLNKALVFLVMLSTFSVSYADREGKIETSLLIPYFNGKQIDFEGGARADLNSDPGFGFSFAYNYTDQLTGRMDMTFNSISYDAERVLDDGNDTVEPFSGAIDSWTLRFGGDYYFTTGAMSPYVNGNIGWNFVDSGVMSGFPQTICWWDPWWGYICDTYIPTYTEDSITYGIGFGIRVDIARSHFVRFGYNIDYVDFDRADGTVDFDSFRVELGFSY